MKVEILIRKSLSLYLSLSFNKSRSR